jgi:hypothetical protein
MAAALYRTWKQALLDAWLSGKTVKAILVKDTYVFSQAHQFRSDLGANTLGTPVTVTSITTNSPNPGTLDIADLLFSAVPAGTSAAIAFYHDTGSAATDDLIYFDDAITGFPLSTSGGDVSVTISAGADRLFTL